jgi:hypothetical protein
LVVFVSVEVAAMRHLRRTLLAVGVPETVVNSKRTRVVGAESFQIEAWDEMMPSRPVHLAALDYDDTVRAIIA